MTEVSQEYVMDESSNDSTDFILNGTINGSSDSFDNDIPLTNDTMRILFLTIATITIVICLTICISVCIFICINRRRNFKRQEKKDQRLLPEQSEKITSTNSLIKTGKDENDKKQNSPLKIQQSSSSNIIIGKTSIKTYYDNLDDIPFIDESRPTSYIDITRV